MTLPVEISVTTVWKGYHRVEIPEGMSAADAVDQIRRGGLPEWAAEQLESSATELTDWDADEVTG